MDNSTSISNEISSNLILNERQINGNDLKEEQKPAEMPPQTEIVSEKPKTTKPKKRKKPRDSTAPRHPLTGYVRFLNDRRENVRTANPNLSFVEITKILASEWSNLPQTQKQQYLEAAEQDRERYTREFNAYKQTDAYKLFTHQQNEKKLKEEVDKQGSSKTSHQIVTSTPVPANHNSSNQLNSLINNNNNSIDHHTNTTDVHISGTTGANTQNQQIGNFDIPIFTEEFLDHNKTRDGELRQLRKSNTDYEQQNSILMKHIENMKVGIEKLEVEIAQQRKNNNSLQQHLDHLRNTLTNGFSGLKLPGYSESATLSSIDNFMSHLHTILLENSSHDTVLLQKVRDIVGRLEFNG